MVVNPLRRAYDKAIRRLDHQLARLRNHVADAARKKQPTAELKSEIRDLEDARQDRQGQPQGGTQALPGRRPRRSRKARRPAVARAPPPRRHPHDRLPRRDPHDASRHAGAGQEKPIPGNCWRALLAADADILPDPVSGVLRVRILGLGNDACDRQIDALLTELNTTGTVFPGTELRMVYEVDGDPKSAQPVSLKISRGQEV